MQLDLLRCTSCATPLVLADRATVTCPSCGTQNDVPAAHREALARMQRDRASRAEAEALYARLGRPPRLLRVIGVLFDPSGVMGPLAASRRLLLRAIGWYYRGVLVVISPFALLLAALIAVHVVMRAIGAHYHANVIETIPTATRDWIQLPVPIAAVLVGTVLGVYGRRKAIERHSLQAALAARPPEHAGGPSTCRACGAPLSVAGSALGACCVYCGADNLVALPAAWLAQLGASTRAVDREITLAGAELARQHARLRRSLWRRVGGVVAALGAAIGIAVATGADRPQLDTAPPSWPSFAGDPRPVVRRDVELAHGRRVMSDRVQALAFAGGCPAAARSLALPSEACAGARCTVRLYAALRDGDVAELTITGAPAEVTIEDHEGYPWPDTPAEPFGDVVVARASSPVTFTAAWSSWYELAITVPAGTALVACFAVRPAGAIMTRRAR
jgi:hypothetical protein